MILNLNSMDYISIKLYLLYSKGTIFPTISAPN